MGKQVCPLPSDDGFHEVRNWFRRFYSGEKMRLDAPWEVSEQVQWKLWSKKPTK